MSNWKLINMSSLIDLIFFSEKRKNLLVQLANGPMDINEIKEVLNVNSCALMPQIKKLKDMDMIVQKGSIYQLSDIGTVIVERMLPLKAVLDVFDGNKDYWSKHDRSPIPEHLIKKIDMLKKCNLDEPDLDHLFEFPGYLRDKLNDSKTIKSFYSYFCPDCPSIHAACAENGAEVHLMLDEKVYNRFKNDFTEEFNVLLENKVSLYIYSGKIRPSSFMVTDNFFMLKLFGKEGEFDHRKITSFTPGALEWGNELAQYYIDRSTKIN
ncbi:winged helix-turn-helix domain-containing protein [Methanosarcina sp. Kolksee]|uniref:helix-turn-helix transcriptional regulator n=1 Tax=Methanosarcina sp. Kolksee TaxID=1434099 RepID=UPI00064FC9A4|nr:winged helix-turn-helix domain-containing protein [Methanosarcina sp. Kolksee]